MAWAIGWFDAMYGVVQTMPGASWIAHCDCIPANLTSGPESAESVAIASTTSPSSDLVVMATGNNLRHHHGDFEQDPQAAAALCARTSIPVARRLGVSVGPV
jgi:hypothetical protein